jgi:lipoprotein-releasing system permease protein
MISGLLILILERTSAIGTLKALGATNTQIRHTFLYFAAFIIGRGLFWGNLLGLGFIWIQDKWGIIRLNADNYYMEIVPVELNLLHLLFLNIGTLLITILALIAPSFIISKIEPAKVIRFD